MMNETLSVDGTWSIESELPDQVPESVQPPELVWDHVSKTFERHKKLPTAALSDICLSIPASQFVSIVGPSGCGKTTLLSLAAGLTDTTSGQVLQRGVPIAAVNTSVGYVSQSDTLLPWRTVEKNIALPLEIRGRTKGEIRDATTEMLKVVGLEGFEHHYPHELSGGMLKRVLFARTLVYEPTVMLLDEPFGALDAQMRLVLQTELMELWNRTGVTIVLVTHDIDEAVSLSDRVVVLSGRPSSVAEILDVDLPRPRNLVGVKYEPGFREISESIWRTIVEGESSGGLGTNQHVVS
jgi:NitT/TauT family transport system ATP-binding protein